MTAIRTKPRSPKKVKMFIEIAKLRILADISEKLPGNKKPILVRGSAVEL